MASNRLSRLFKGHASCRGRIEHLPQVRDGIRNVLNRAGQNGPGRVGMAAALESFSDFQRLAVAAAQAHQNHSVAAAEKGDQHRVRSRSLFEQLVNNLICISDDGVDETHSRAEFGDI